MATINERAENFYFSKIEITEKEKKAYIKGATEQKSIDDAEWTDRLVKCETRKNEQIKKALIDKASEWIISRAAPEEKDIIAKEFRKAMED